MNKERILLIGDDLKLLKKLRRDLASQGYRVWLALDDQDAYEMTAMIQPDLFVLSLDFAFTGIDGMSVCSQLQKNSRSPLLALSANKSEKVEKYLLRGGASDYLPLPVDREKFLGRVWYSLWLHKKLTENPVDVGYKFISHDLMIDPTMHQVLVRREWVRLTPKEYDLFLALAVDSGKVITHKELLTTVWGSKHTQNKKYLWNLVSRLRKKIEDDPVNPNFLVSKKGVGYLFQEAVWSGKEFS